MPVQPYATQYQPQQQQPQQHNFPEPIHVGKKEKETNCPVYSATDANIHSHPYGFTSADTDMRPTSVSASQYSANNNPGIQNAPHQHQQRDDIVHMLPPRDLPRNDIGLNRQLDPSIQPGYIPPLLPGTHVSEEYIRQRALATDREMREYQSRKYRDAQIGQVVDAIQIPVLLAILFFLFNATSTNLWLFHVTSSFGGHDDTGNLNTIGLGVKSAIFGAVYYLANMIMDFGIGQS